MGSLGRHAVLAPEQHYGEASMGQRFWTYLLDSVFLFVIFFTLAAIYGGVTALAGSPSGPGGLGLRVAAIGVAAAYYFMLEWLLGRTLGKMMHRDPGHPRPGRAAGA